MPSIRDKFLFVDSTEARLFDDALASGHLSGHSEWLAEYASDLAAYFAVPNALPVSSGSAALHTALYVLGAGPGTEVLLPAATTIPTALPVLTTGATPVFVDNQPDNFGFDLDDLARKISPRTRAALLVPLWGYPIDYAPILRLLDEASVPLIEDAAQAHGASLHSRKVGTFGTIGCFSTHDRKLVSTGEGGFLLLGSTRLFEEARTFTRLGDLDGAHFGMNYKPCALQCVLGKARLRHLDEQVRKRTVCAERFRATVAEVGRGLVEELRVPANSVPNYYSLVLNVPSSSQAATRFAEELERFGVPSDVRTFGFEPRYRTPLFQKYYRDDCVNAERLTSTITTVPVHPGLTDVERETIDRALTHACRSI